MTNSFNMSNWRRKHILMAENDSDPKAAREYDQAIHGKITSFEDVLFEPEEAPTNIIFSVATEKDTENAKDITVPFEKFAKWANEEGFDLEDENISRDAGKKYFEEYYSNYLTDEGKKSLRAQMQEAEEPSQEENPIDIISVDVPLFIRMLEFAREDASTDMDLHDLAQKAIKMSSKGEPLTMIHYDELTSKEAPVTDAMSLYEKYFNA
jgi:hypothetical protein